MESCKNCYWEDKCRYAGIRCEYYDPILGEDDDDEIAMKEFDQYIRENTEEYQSIVDEMQS